MNVTLRITRYSVILPLDTSTLWSLTQAPVRPLMVCDARDTPCLTASSKLFVLVEMISITLATDIRTSRIWAGDGSAMPAPRISALQHCLSLAKRAAED